MRALRLLVRDPFERLTKREHGVGCVPRTPSYSDAQDAPYSAALNVRSFCQAFLMLIAFARLIPTQYKFVKFSSHFSPSPSGRHCMDGEQRLEHLPRAGVRQSSKEPLNKSIAVIASEAKQSHNQQIASSPPAPRNDT